jgi:hypothetical protein
MDVCRHFQEIDLCIKSDLGNRLLREDSGRTHGKKQQHDWQAFHESLGGDGFTLTGFACGSFRMQSATKRAVPAEPALTEEARRRITTPLA